MSSSITNYTQRMSSQTRKAVINTVCPYFTRGNGFTQSVLHNGPALCIIWWSPIIFNSTLSGWYANLPYVIKDIIIGICSQLGSGVQTSFFTILWHIMDFVACGMRPITIKLIADIRKLHDSTWIILLVRVKSHNKNIRHIVIQFIYEIVVDT